MLAERIDPVAPASTAPASASVRNPVDAARRVRAVLFDLDGTLYRQPPVRASMACELAMQALIHPLQAPVTWRVLSAFRKAQETLRGRQGDSGGGQADIAARQTGLTVARVEGIVQEWMVTRPLKHLARYRAAGLLPLLDFLTGRGIKMGVFSDYPAALKLQALGIDGRFSLVLCSTDPDIGVFKPHPRGFLVASERWRVSPSEILVVGDRPDADAAGAAAAGMPCVIVGRSQASPADASGFGLVPSLERLRNVLDDDHRGH